MACRTLTHQILRGVKLLRCGRFSSIVSTSTKQHYFLHVNAIPIPQFNSAKQYSTTSEINIPVASYDDIKQLPQQPEILLIDVREPEELKETGQIPTSINIPLGQVTKELGKNYDASAFKAKYGREKPQRHTEIIFHCKIGRRSQNAAEIAKNLGYLNAKNYLGSWTEWAEKEGLSK